MRQPQYRLSFRRFLLGWGVLLCIAEVLISCGSNQPTTSQPPTAVPRNSPTATVDISATKFADETQEVIDHATAWANRPSATQGLPTLPPDPPTIPIPTPILGQPTFCESNLPGGRILITNCWKEVIGNEFIAVLAGKLYVPQGISSDPNKGMLVVVRGNASTYKELSSATYYTTTGGALKVIAATYPRYTLEAADGSLFVFNVETESWEGTSATMTPNNNSPRPTIDISATKFADETQEVIDHATAWANRPSATQGLPTLPPAPPTIPIPTPILGQPTFCESDLPGDRILNTNCWKEIIGNELITVLAGKRYVPEGISSDPNEGMLVVVRRNALTHKKLSPSSDYYTTTGGALKVIAATYPRYTLEAADGSLFVFNVETESWEGTSATPTWPPEP